MQHRQRGPVGLVEGEDVLLRLAVARDESLVIDAVLAAFAPRIRRKVEHRPDERAPESRLSDDLAIVRRVQLHLRLLGMQRTARIEPSRR